MAYPSVSGGIQNTFLTPDVIAREALLILENNVISPQVMSTSAVSDFTGAKVGDTIRVRRPAFFGVDTFARTDGGNEVIKIQDAKENSVNLVIEKHFDVSFEVSSVELALAVDDFNERFGIHQELQWLSNFGPSHSLSLGPTASGKPNNMLIVQGVF